MLYDTESLSYLSGVSSHDDYHDSLEARSPSKSKSKSKKPELLSEASKIRNKKSRAAIQEAKLRKLIRSELKSVLAEIETEKAEKAISNAQKTKSVGVSMGFSGVGFGAQKTPSNGAEQRKPGTPRGFLGPGVFEDKQFPQQPCTICIELLELVKNM